MAHTNSTTHYSLPQFLSSDKPAWLAYINPAYNSIDSGIYEAKHSADTALSIAESSANAIENIDASIAPKYSNSIGYSLDDIVIYNHKLYKCIFTITIPEAFTPSHWREINLTDDTGVINGEVTKQIESQAFNSLSTTAKTLLAAINEVDDHTDSITDKVNANIGNVKLKVETIEGNSTKQSPTYSNICYAFVARGSSAIFAGANNGVSTVVSSNYLTCTWESGNHINIRNTGNTCVVIFLYL